MASPVKPIPEGYHTATPYLVVNGAARAIAFYKKAFGAQELFRMDGPDGKIGHTEIKIGDSPIMLSDEMMGNSSPQSLGGSPGGIRCCDSCAAKLPVRVSSGCPFRSAVHC